MRGAVGCRVGRRAWGRLTHFPLEGTRAGWRVWALRQSSRWTLGLRGQEWPGARTADPALRVGRQGLAPQVGPLPDPPAAGGEPVRDSPSAAGLRRCTPGAGPRGSSGQPFRVPRCYSGAGQAAGSRHPAFTSHPGCTPRQETCSLCVCASALQRPHPPVPPGPPRGRAVSAALPACEGTACPGPGGGGVQPAARAAPGGRH